MIESFNTNNINESVKEGLVIENFVEDNEEILWRAQPNKKAYILSKVITMMPIALLWLAFDVAFITILAVNVGDELGGFWAFIVPFMLIHLAPVWIWIGGIIKARIEIKNLDYAITNKKIIIKSGVIGVDFKIITFPEIQTVTCKVQLTDKLFHVGDLHIIANQQSAVIFDIDNPYEMYCQLQKIVVDVQSDINYPNAMRPAENPGYNTKYSK